MENNNSSARPLAQNILLFCVIILSLSGIYLFKIGDFEITPFYLFSPLLVISYFYLKLYNNEEIQKYRIFIRWLIIVAIASSAISLYIRPSALLHFMFYVFNGYILICLGCYCSSDESFFLKLAKINKFIIYIFSFDVVIANILYVLGVENSFLSALFPVYYDYDKIRFAAFTSEPSYLAIILTICIMSLISYSKIYEEIKFKRELIFYVVALVLARTTYGFMCIGLTFAFLYQQNSERIENKVVIYIRLILLSLFLVIGIWLLQENEYLQRLGSLIGSITTENNLESFIYNLNDNDSSAAMRILPSFLFFQSISWLDLQLWFGHGIGANTQYFTDVLEYTEKTINLGFIPAAIYDFGLLGSFSFIYLIFKRGVSSVPWIMKLLLFLSFVNCNISTQLFWFCVIQLLFVSMTRDSELEE